MTVHKKNHSFFTKFCTILFFHFSNFFTIAKSIDMCYRLSTFIEFSRLLSHCVSNYRELSYSKMKPHMIHIFMHTIVHECEWVEHNGRKTDRKLPIIIDSSRSDFSNFCNGYFEMMSASVIVVGTVCFFILQYVNSR